jgi:hypothetical protein
MPHIKANSRPNRNRIIYGVFLDGYVKTLNWWDLGDEDIR